MWSLGPRIHTLRAQIPPLRAALNLFLYCNGSARFTCGFCGYRYSIHSSWIHLETNSLQSFYHYSPRTWLRECCNLERRLSVTNLSSENNLNCRRFDWMLQSSSGRKCCNLIGGGQSIWLEAASPSVHELLKVRLKGFNPPMLPGFSFPCRKRKLA